MGSNGTLITEDIASEMREVPVSRVAVSLDFPTPGLQDNFRGKSGAFEAAVAGIENCQKAGIEVQINSTITKLNVSYLNDLVDLVIRTGAVAFHPFLLVPTGRGKNLRPVELSPQEYESTLNWIYDKQVELGDKLFFKPTDAPHYLRVLSQRREHGPKSETPVRVAPAAGQRPLHAVTRGCLAGIGFCFVSYRGDVQGCGYLDVRAGKVTENSFGEIWRDSQLFRELRNIANLKGKCGRCEYKRVCGGCRARAYESSGDYLQAEPYCIYEPGKRVIEAAPCS